MGAGEEIKDIYELKKFHTPSPEDGGKRDYHAHSSLLPHFDFARTVLNYAKYAGLEIDDIAFKVDKVVDDEITARGFFGQRKVAHQVKIAQRFFLIARIRNPEYQLADNVETFIIARNSHDKRLPMEVAIGNKVVVCSNLMFGGDIAIKARNSMFGEDNLKARLSELFGDYLNSVGKLRDDVDYFKNTAITAATGLAFIGTHASSGRFIQTGRTAAVCDMFLQPEHSKEYQNEKGHEKYTLWRLLNAYTYVHRGELCIDPETGLAYPDQRRTSVCALELKKEFTKELWAALLAAQNSMNNSVYHYEPLEWWRGLVEEDGVG